MTVGLWLRLYQLDKPLMWCDEAESSINALTILQDGLPTDTYLGLPIYENTLTDPWPEHPEYEFRDSSYSSKRLAIYHGWLPLYSMAGSLKLFGIEPDTDLQTYKPVHDVDAIARRTIAARLPSVVAGVVFMLVVFFAAREMYGNDAAWAAVVVAAVAVPMVNIARQARYYSMTVTLAACCCWAGWRLYKRGYWRDYLFAAVAFSLLFHTHILTFATACAACALLLPFMFRHEKAVWKMLACAAFVALATVPWIIATDFLGSAQSVPKAIATMKLPDDLLSWPLKRWPVTAVLVAGMLFMAALHLRANWFSDRIHKAFTQHRAAFYFLGAWILIGYAMFMSLIPAASLFFTRLYLAAVGPGIIFGAMLFAGVGRSMSRRIAVPASVAAFVLFVVVQTFTLYTWNRERGQYHRMAAFFDEIKDWEFRPGSRIYATPNDHLTLQYYTGLPIQSIAPVRRSFLDNYPGDVVLINCRIPVWPLSENEVKDLTRRRGLEFSRQDIKDWTETLNRVGAGRRVANQVRAVSPAIDDLPDWGEDLLEWQLEKTVIYRRRVNYEMMNPAMFRGFTHLRDDKSLWEVFFYRFVNPTDRIGKNANYANRLLRAEAKVMPTMWVVYTSPGIAGADPVQASRTSTEEKN